jgi:O-antigen/teichoic acid export membrane protein
VRSRDRDHDAGRSLRRAATHLVTNAGITSGLGLAYWLVAARLLPPRQFGRGSALVALILTLSTFSQMNFNVALSRILPRSGDGVARVVAKIYAATATVSVVVGAAFLVAAPGAFRYLSAIPAAPLLLGLATGVWTIFALEDNVLATVRRTSVIPIENATFGAAKLIMLAVLVACGVTRYSIVASSIAPLLAIVLVVNAYLFVVVLPSTEVDPEPTVDRDVSSRGFAWYDYAGSIAWLAGTIALPVIVASLVGPAQEATFYVPFTVAIAVDTVTINLGNALTAEAIRTRSRGEEQAGIAHFLRLLGAALLLCVIIGIAVSPFLLDAYGAHYRQTGTWTMRIIVLAILPRAALFLGLAIARSTGRGSTIVAAQFVTTIVTLGAGVPLVHALGIAGMAIAWLVGSSCGAVWVTVRATVPYVQLGTIVDATLGVPAVARPVSPPQ